jgi:hypothetical protein
MQNLNQLFVLTGTIAVVAACSSDSDTATKWDEGYEDTASDGIEWDDSSFARSVGFGPEMIELLLIEYDPNAEYFLGMVQVSDCAEGECWFGEDCHEGSYCHPVSGYKLELAYGSSVEEGTTTVFPGQEAFDYTTYILDDRSRPDGPCYVGGQDSSHYDSYPKSCETW